MKQKELFESGAMLVRNYEGHEQMLMNEGDFKELLKRELVKLLEFMIEEKMHPNGFGGWGYNSVNNYGSHNEDIVRLFQKKLSKI